MKRLLAATLLLFLSGCYSENKAIVEGGRPVEIQLKNMDHALKVAIPEIDGCDYFVAYSHPGGQFFRASHYPQCRNCTNRTWPDGVKPMESVEIRDNGTYYVVPLKIGECEYFTLGGWGSYPDDIIHRGHCKACAKKRF